MVVTFEKEYLRELYETEKTTDKKYRFQPHVVSKYVRCVDILLGAPNLEALYKFNSLNYEVLKGNKKGISCAYNLFFNCHMELANNHPLV